jgi:hypothetical protein
VIVAPANGSISIDALLAAKRLVQEAGSVERAKEAIEKGRGWVIRSSNRATIDQ